MTFVKVTVKAISVIAIVVIVAGLLTVMADIVSFTNRGYTIGQAVRWELDDTIQTWGKILQKQPEERTWYPMANQNIDWNWQKNER